MCIRDRLKALQKIDKEDRAALEAFKNANFLTDEDIAAMQGIDVPVSYTHLFCTNMRATCSESRAFIWQP